MATEQDANNERQGKNDAQQVRNDAQQVQNDTQSRTNTDVQGQIDSLVSTADVSRDIVIVLADSVRANTHAMQRVSEDLAENLKVYQKIDERIDKVEKYANEIKRMSDVRARTFRKLWKLAIVIAVVLSLLLSSAFYFVSRHAALQACEDRNTSNALVSGLIQQFYDIGSKQQPPNAFSGVEKNYLDHQVVPIDCGYLPWH